MLPFVYHCPLNKGCKGIKLSKLGATWSIGQNSLNPPEEEGGIAKINFRISNFFFQKTIVTPLYALVVLEQTNPLGEVKSL